MKRFVILILSIVLPLSLGACGENKNTETENELVVPNTIKELETIIEKDIDEVAGSLQGECKQLIDNVDTYDKYVKKTNEIEAFYATSVEATKELCLKMKKHSVTYANLVVTVYGSGDEQYNAFENLYDCIYTESFEDIYDLIYEKLYDELYDAFYSGIINDASDSVDYDKWSATSSNAYEVWGNYRSDIYDEWMSARSSVFNFVMDAQSAALSNDSESMKNVISDFEKNMTTSSKDSQQELEDKSLDKEDTGNKDEFSLEKAPTEEYITACLKTIPTISDVVCDYDNEGSIENSMLSERIVGIYFTSTLVDQSEFDKEENAAEKGTVGGGCVEVYDSKSDAEKRKEYLEEQNDSFSGIFVNNGSHTVFGTMVIRTSGQLDEEEQQLLEDAVISALEGENDFDELSEFSRKLEVKRAQQNDEIEKPDDEEDGIESKPKLKKGEVVTPRGSYILEGSDSKEVMSLMKEAGFTNVKRKAVYDLGTGFWDSMKKGEVISVSIAGKKEFEEGDIFKKDNKVIIKYHALEMNNPNIEYKTRSVSKLIDELEANAMRAKKNYEGAYIKTKGRIGEIDSGGDYFVIYPADDEYAFQGVNCAILTDKQREKMMKLSKGDIVTVKGKVTTVGDFIGYAMDSYKIIIK